MCVLQADKRDGAQHLGKGGAYDSLTIALRYLSFKMKLLHRNFKRGGARYALSNARDSRTDISLKPAKRSF